MTLRHSLRRVVVAKVNMVPRALSNPGTYTASMTSIEPIEGTVSLLVVSDFV
jgi:hypothetical protein